MRLLSKLAIFRLPRFKLYRKQRIEYGGISDRLFFHVSPIAQRDHAGYLTARGPRGPVAETKPGRMARLLLLLLPAALQ